MIKNENTIPKKVSTALFYTPVNDLDFAEPVAWQEIVPGALRKSTIESAYEFSHYAK